MKILDNKLCNHKFKNKGFTLIELVVAILIFSIGILGIAKLQAVAVQGNSFSMQMTDAVNIAYNQLEYLSVLDYISSPELQLNNHPNDSTSSFRGVNYTLSWSVSTTGLGLSVDVRDLVVTIDWMEKNTPHSITVRTRKGLN
ncbi:MAG: prepilin-type N-terminal cleavage/methylation domain-containing protein [Deltaproteobacteria bacterium]|nr:prepilin-type N-terminal cleavage/methylation domain-containing protein [Deltaproteobacteria bacterium]